MHNKYNSDGFTLVEISIVLIIVGLLIGGILKGQEIVENSRLTGTIRLIKTVEASALSFKDRYSNMPGDVAAAKIPGCNLANNCSGGDENGAVGTDALGLTDGSGTRIWWTTRMNPSDVMGAETYMFWKHLALTGFISGVDPAANIVAEAAWTVTNPETPFGGGLEFFYDGRTTIGFVGHFVRISGNGVGGAGALDGILSPSQAASIDRKLDDGDPSQGTVFADYGTNNNDCKTWGVYDESNTSATCVLFIGLFNK